jgi:hypothetical protein
MHLANLTTAGFKRISGLVLTLFIYSFASAQENSPYSRYAVGDLVPNQNVVSRGMGGVSIGYSDYQSINFINPASLSNITNTILDLGGEVDIRTLKSTSSAEKYTATNTLISYLQLGFPLLSRKLKKKDEKKNIFWGLSFGLRPISRISYKIETNERIQLPPLSDSLNTLYEGSGGINQFNIGTGLMIKNLSFGINTGYSFGTKDYSTKKQFINDSIVYYKSNTEAQTRFSGFFLNLGVQYAIAIKKNGKKIGLLNIGAYGNLQQNLKATENNINETFNYDGNGGTYTIDTVIYQSGLAGHIKIPATYGVGATYTNKKWLLGMDFETSNWSSYRYYGQTDAVQNSWTIRAGAQYFPAKENTASRKYWNFVRYRAGFYYGPDYIKLTSNRPNYAVTAGASFPLTANQSWLRFGEYVLLNTAVEIGARGNKQTLGVRENITRINIGISMNARWFQKRKYD